MLSTGARRNPRGHHDHAGGPLLDHLVGGGQQRFRDGNAERLGGLHVDNQLDLRRLLHREIGRLVALENAAGINPSLVYLIATSASIGHQASSEGMLTESVDRGQPIAGRQRRELFHTPGVEGIVADQDGTNMLLRKSCECRFEIAIGAGIHNNELQAQHARRRLQVCDGGLGNRKRRVRQNAEQGGIW
jgi:hypothetical protein